MAAAAVCVPNRGFVESPLTKIAGRKRSCAEEYYLTATKKVCFRSGDYIFSVADTGSVESTPQSNTHNDDDFNVNHRRGDNPPPNNNNDDDNIKAEWVDLMIKEMMAATSIDDAKFRASRLLEDILEKFAPVKVAGGGGFPAGAHQSRLMQEKIEAMSKENSVLKKAVVIQHQRQKKYEEDEEKKQLRELVKRYEDQVKSLENSNYGLTVHLQQALSSSAIPIGFPPHVF
ncbi:OLC1v1014307C1 [Oldenlandia corymbosa var. corymbosa]|uniref:OLC1v1014307C1 n=1 Tax=Oldenlandia corymbosa var. corymbosa TaxID=529605 RepID=A0AAV1E0D0_OLDCO|nr:OLC1v1014307C1 [Oldenlandia corymbosa var. corymbosa]